MFEKVSIPLIALINNMAYYNNPIDNTKLYPFGRNSAQDYAETLGITSYFDIPLLETVSAQSDNGEPAALIDDDSDFGKTLMTISEALTAHVNVPLLEER